MPVDNVLTYLWGVLTEGALIALLFWGIMYITVESSSGIGALRAGLISEAVANLPYLFGQPAFNPITLGMTIVGAFIFVRVILRVGELNALKAWYGIMMTYFALVAVVACAPVN